MKSLQFIVTLVLLSINLYPQAGWNVQLGGVNPNYYNRDIFFLNSQTGWILQNDKIKFTDNAGENWLKIPLDLPGDYYTWKIFFINADTGWITGTGMFKTTNGGMDWTIINNISSVNSIYFINSQTGWFCGNSGQLEKTIDGGLSWTGVYTGTQEKLNCVYFLNEQTGFLAADWGKIFRTINGGSNWETYYDDINYSFMQSIKFINGQTGFVCATGGNIFKTTNTGANWLKVNTGYSSSFKDILFTDPLNGYAMGIREVYRTTNCGNNWFQTSFSGLFANVSGMEAFENGNIWIIADSTLVYKSIDNCQSWQEKFRDIFTYASLSYIRFFDGLTGIACGSNGTILRTTNGGLNWSKTQTGTSYSLSAVYLMNQNTGYAGGGDNYLTALLLRTTDRGLTWNNIYSDTTGPISSLSFLNENTGFVSGSKGLLKTINGGFNWFRFTPHTQTFGYYRDVKFIDENTGFTLRYSGGYYKTTNGGANWFTPQVISNPNYSIDFFNSNTGIMFGKTSNASVLFKTTNAGVNWSDNVIGSVYFNDVHFINENKGWAVGSGTDSLVQMTINAGANWIIQPVDVNATLASVYFIDDNTGWACGIYGTIVHTTNGGSIGITNISNEIPPGFKLFQNYPNPFNPLTKIKFDVMEKTFVKLEIYNSIGQIAGQLVNTELDRGSYAVDWNAENFASGVYFYILKVGDEYTHAKKMIFIK